MDTTIVVALRAHLKPDLKSFDDTSWINIQTTRLFMILKISLSQWDENKLCR